MRLLLPIGLAVAALLLQGLHTSASAADRCPDNDQPINTDRPGASNSSTVVPFGSLQSENGVDFSSQSGAGTVDGPNSRLRLGLAPCLEFLVDLPSYLGATNGTTNGTMNPSGFSDIGPAIKWQISPDPGNLDLSVTLGAALPSGAIAISGPGIQPYLQFPWSKNLSGGWSLGGMLSFFTSPADPQSKLTTETTLEITKELTQGVQISTEYAVDFIEHDESRQMITSSVLWQFTKTQQLDAHIGFGLTNNSPNFAVGAGYSFRIDSLFK
jgi:Putative MetA-pathway of phenol degradation